MRSLLETKSHVGLVIAFVLAFGSTVASAAQMETLAKYAYMVDQNSGQVLYEKNAETPMGPSSMTKLMTAYMVFDALKRGSITLETKFPISIKAWKKGGSKMYVKEGDDVKVGDLIQGILVVSGNDACIAMAEGLAGSEEFFAEDMNAMSKKIGMTGSNFKNASGWPEDGHLMTAKDLVTLGIRLKKDFPEYYHYFSQTSFTYADIKQPNRNKLLYKNIGVDGMKTGYTRDNGYGMTVSAERDGRRVVVSINGLKKVKQRYIEAERLLRHAFRNYQQTELYAAGSSVENAKVWLGEAGTVPLVIESDLSILVPKRASQRGDYALSVAYDGPLEAPVKKGDKVAMLTLTRDGEIDKEIPLVAGADVPRLGLTGRMMHVLMDKIFGPAE
jgi:D-alanyl-D-alanine carboxypeptidase (penicillin-binding protein 5/6)